MAGQIDSQYNIYDTGCDKSLFRGVRDQVDIMLPNVQSSTPLGGGNSTAGGSGVTNFNGGLFEPVEQVTNPQSISAGELPAIIGFGKKSFTDTTSGWLQGVDSDNVYKWIIGGASSSADWSVTTPDTFTIIGSINVSAGGTIGGFQVGSDYVRDVANSFGLASTVTGGDDIRLWAGDSFANRASAPFRVTESGALVATSATITGAINVSAGGTIGGFDVGSDYIRDAANSFGLASTVTGGDDVRFWSGDTFANRATAPFRVTEAGSVTAANISITGGSISGTTTVGIGNVNIAARGWTQTSIFSVSDADTVAWGAGTFTSADGTSYSISGSNTGNMAAATYIYLDIAVSTTAYQTTTTAANAVGAGKVLIAKAQNGTGEATFEVFGGIGGQNINASSIVSNSITANELSTSITYAGSIIIDTSGHIRSGQTAYNTGTGWFIGNDSGTAKLSLGNGTSRLFTWDGTDMTVAGNLRSLTYLTAGEDLTAGDAVQINLQEQPITSNDAQVNSGSAGTNYGSSTTMEVNGTSGSGQHSYLKFDLSFLAANISTNLVSATLYVYSTNSNSQDGVSVRAVSTADWSEGTITWTNRPTGVTTIASGWDLNGVGWKSVVLDLTTVKGWISGAVNNYGLYILPNNDATGAILHTKENTNDPYLELVFNTGLVYKADARISYNTARWLGFCLVTTSKGNSAPTMVGQTYAGLSGLTAGEPYYLSNTRGSISTSAGTVSKKVGLAVSTTELLMLNT